MLSEKELRYVKSIKEKIVLIKKVVIEYKYVSRALEDATLGRPALLMHLTAMAEKFEKLKQENAFEVLAKFKRDVRCP